MSNRQQRRNALKKTAVLLFLLSMVCAPLAGHALQERNITDEPSVNKPQAPAKPAQPAPATPAEKAPAKAEAQAPEQQSYQPSSPSQPSSGGSWTPSETKDAAKQDATPQSGQGSGKIFDMPEAKQVQVSTYSRKEVDEQVMGFFEGGARGLADLISRAFEKYGEPTGFIKGNEGAGALVVGLRYGEGWLYLKNGKKVYVYWQSPSVGFDLGVNASKVFCMIYNMTDPEQIFQRYPSIDGSAYIVGGFGMNYQQSGKVILAPIRFGVGLRLGANVGYMHFTRERTINPF
jgi:hypothetical protein